MNFIENKICAKTNRSYFSLVDKGLQICWTPDKEIPQHFVPLVFSNPGKSDGGPIRTSILYQHLGIAQIFYQNSESKSTNSSKRKNSLICRSSFIVVDRVIHHGPTTFQSFTFTPRLLRRTIDSRHLCFANMSLDHTRVPSYIDTVSMPYKTSRFHYYQNDQQTILVEYQEDIGKRKVFSFRKHSSCFN